MENAREYIEMRINEYYKIRNEWSLSIFISKTVEKVREAYENEKEIKLNEYEVMALWYYIQELAENLPMKPLSPLA